MIKKIVFIVAFLLGSIYTFGQQEKNLLAYLSYGTFTVPGEGSYLETYLAVSGQSVVFAAVGDSLYQANIQVTIIFMQDSTVQNYTKYELQSPLVEDPEETNFGIIDQQRFMLSDGEYQMFIEIFDLNNPEVPAFSTEETVVLEFPDDAIQISAIQLIDTYHKVDVPSVITKNDYDLIPLVYAFYPASNTALNFYTEVYFTDLILGDEGKFLVSYFIESAESQNMMQDFIFRKRMDSKPVNVLMSSIDISQLPSGNYNLAIEVRDIHNEILASNKLFFRRYNPAVTHQLSDLSAVNISHTFVDQYEDIEIMREYLRCLAPLSSEAERDYAYNLSNTAELSSMQRFFYYFWEKRNYDEPEKAWLTYFEDVIKVNATYKTITKRGYESDRGRVYLKYGPPNHIAESYNEPAAYPYEIWHYYSLGNQRNKRFVFVTKDMATNDFVLVHSDAIGELANYRWQLDIYKRTWDPNNIDQTSPDDAFGNRAYDYYKHPR